MHFVIKGRDDASLNNPFLLVNKIGCRGHKENSSVVQPSHAVSVLLSY